jgi:hypothetical protein
VFLLKKKKDAEFFAHLNLSIMKLKVTGTSNGKKPAVHCGNTFFFMKRKTCTISNALQSAVAALTSVLLGWDT